MTKSSTSQHQEKIKNILLGDEILNDIGEFPWYLTKDVTNDNLPDSQKRPGSFHALVKYNVDDDNRLGNVSSLFHELILTINPKLKMKPLKHKGS